MYLGIASIGPSLPWRACWNMFITPKKDMMRPAVRGHNQGRGHRTMVFTSYTILLKNQRDV